MRTCDPKRGQQILDAAAQLFAKHRYHEVRMDDIAEHANVAKGTVYRYFHDKEDLYLALTRHGLNQLFAESQAIINRLGFNNEGCDAIAPRLQRLRESTRWPAIPVGINIGKSKITPLEEATADYLLSYQRLQHCGDYFVLNVSSPNTPGLRSLQDRRALDELLGHIQRRNSAGKPMVLKIAPDSPPNLLETTTNLETPGAYVVRWQVLAIDGHITRGDVPFTVMGH